MTQRDKQPAVWYPQKSARTNMHSLCVSVGMCVCGARANQRHTRHHRSSRVCEWCLHVCASACAFWYYLANASTVSVCLTVCLQVHTKTHTHTSNTKNTGQYMSRNDRKSTLSLNHSISVPSHDQHAHSLKRWKIGKNVRWQVRQLVVGQKKLPVSRRNSELGQPAVSYPQDIYIYTYIYIYIHTQTHKYACWYVWL